MAHRTESHQFAALVRIFVARFFENDLTNSAHDLKRSFFGLLGVFGVPGAMWPFVMGFTWTLVGRYQGVAVLRDFSRGDKDLYLGFSMIAAAMLGALTWDTLLLDRRDAIVLGSLPVRPRVIIGAKLAALGLYVGTVAVTMHGLAAGTWGLFLDEGRGRSLGFFIRGIGAHFLAGTAASTFTVIVLLAVQGLLLAIGGPRLFARLSGVFQVLLVVAIGVALIAFPAGAQTVVHALAFPADRAQGWALALPPAWFLGLYELLLGGLGHFGGADFVLRQLAARALTLWLGTCALALLANVAAYRRVMRSAIEEETSASPRLGLAARGVAAVVTTRPTLRAVVAFFLTSITRVARQRLALGVGIGVAVAWAVPLLPRWPALAASPTPDPTLLTLPLALMVVWLAALRVAASLPADLKAGWIFELHRPDPVAVRAVVTRVLALIGILPFAVASALMIWARWGLRPAAVHAVFLSAIGLAVVQALVTGIGDVPGTQSWRPERARLRSRWPWYLFGFLWLASGFRVSSGPETTLELLLLESPIGLGVFLVCAGGVIFLVRRYSLERLRLDEVTPRDDESFDGTSVTVRLN